VHSVGDARQIEINTAELLLPDPSPFEFEIVVTKLKSINRQVMIKFGRTYFKEVKQYSLITINSLILFGIWKNFLINGRSLLLYQFTRRLIKLAVRISVVSTLCQ
jgi:hypothetical protein